MVRVLMFGPVCNSGGVSNHTKNIIQELQLQGSTVYFYNFTQDNYSDSICAFIKRSYRRTVGLILEAISKRDQYDLIHVQTSGGIASFISSISGSLASKIVKKKCVITFHYSNTEEFVSRYKRIFGFVLNVSDRMILVSIKQKKYISHIFPEYLDKLISIENGYNKNLYYPTDMVKCRSELNLPLNKKIVYNISNLTETKGHKYLIRALGYVIKKRKDVICIIVGDGYFKNDLISQIESENLQDYVILSGWKPDDEVPIFMNACDIFVHASLKEGNPTVMFEALGCGKPFVGTSVGGVPEIIKSEEYGMLVNPANPEDLAEKILIAVDKKWDRDIILDYADRYTWANIAKETIGVYEQLIGVVSSGCLTDDIINTSV